MGQVLHASLKWSMWSKNIARCTGESDLVHSFLPTLHNLFEYGSCRQVNEKSPKTDLGMRVIKLPVFAARAKSSTCWNAIARSHQSSLHDWPDLWPKQQERGFSLLCYLLNHTILCILRWLLFILTLHLMLNSHIIPGFSKEPFGWNYDTSLLNEFHFIILTLNEDYILALKCFVFSWHIELHLWILVLFVSSFLLSSACIVYI